VAFNAKGTKLLTACGDHYLRLWDAETPELKSKLQGHSDDIWDVKWSHSSGLAASGGWDNRVRVWDPENGSQLLDLTGHQGDVSSVAFNPEGTILATGGEDKVIKLWDLATGRMIINLSSNTHSSAIEEISFTPDGKTLMSSGRDGYVHFWAVPSLEERFSSAVQEAMKTWVIKSPYEKTKDYEKRISRSNQEAKRKRKELEEGLIDFYESNVDWNSSFALGRYNADFEYFIINSPILGTMRLKAVPKEAPEVAANFERIEFRDLEMELVKGELKVKSVIAYSPDLNKRFVARP